MKNIKKSALTLVELIVVIIFRKIIGFLKKIRMPKEGTNQFFLFL